jgi:osmotically-inducible protein OsmY
MVLYDAVSTNIQEALMNDDRTTDAPIEVINHQGIITLTGEVDSLEVAQAAEEIVRQQAGVFKVVNNLYVK